MTIFDQECARLAVSSSVVFLASCFIFRPKYEQDTTFDKKECKRLVVNLWQVV